MYGEEMWALRRKEERFLGTTEMRMLWRIKDVALRDRVRSDKIGSGKITLTARQARLHQYGHILRHAASAVWGRETSKTGEDGGGWYRTLTWHPS